MLVSFDFLYLIQPKNPLPQGATIVKLVTTQAGGVAKPATVLSTQSTTGGQTPTILGISSVQPNVSKTGISLSLCLFSSDLVCI